MTIELDKALSLVPVIREAHDKVESSQLTSYNQALDFAIKAGDALRLAKEAVGHSAFGAWRQQNLANIPQTTASLYMRLAEHKDKFKEARISNSVAEMKSQGKLSLRAAASLLPKRPQTLAQKAAAKARKEAVEESKKSNEGIAKEYINSLAADELVVVLKEIHDADWLRELSGTLTKSLTRSQGGLDPEGRSHWWLPSNLSSVSLVMHEKNFVVVQDADVEYGLRDEICS